MPNVPADFKTGYNLAARQLKAGDVVKVVDTLFDEMESPHAGEEATVTGTPLEFHDGVGVPVKYKDGTTANVWAWRLALKPVVPPPPAAKK